MMTLRKSGIATQSAISSGLDVFVDQLLERVLVGQPHDLFDNLPALEQQQCRDAADAEATGNRGVVVDIQLADRDAPIVVARELINRRAQPLAWAAPLCPEIDQDRLAALMTDWSKFVSVSVVIFSDAMCSCLGEAARQGLVCAAVTAASYTLTYSRAEASQEKSCFMPFCWIFFHSLGFRRARGPGARSPPARRAKAR